MSNSLAKDEWDLQDAWDKACKSFAKTTGADITKRSNLSPTDVLNQIRAKQDKDDADSAKFKVAKEVIGNSLVCIQNLGSIIAQGAGTVFGASNQCFNAVSFLITVGQNYNNIFSSLKELFSRISDVLDRFVIYLRMRDVDIALKKIIHQLLLSFVRICELSIKVLHGNKIKLFLKVFAFNDDEGVKSELALLANLADKESQMKGTLTLESAKITERNVVTGFTESREGFRDVKTGIAGMSSTLDKMKEAERKHEAETTAKKQLQTIKQALDDPKETYQEIQRNFASLKIPGTGQWLQDDSVFMSWAGAGANQEQTSDPILCISGHEGYGKSFLMSTVVQALRKRYPQGQEHPSRTSVAYYYFRQDVKGSQSLDKDMQSLDKALKAVAFQIAQNDPIYQKDLVVSCKGLEDVGEFKELLNKLFVNASNTDATFFILLDGINQIEEKHEKCLLQLLKDVQTRCANREVLRIQVLLSGRVDTLERIKNNLESPILTMDMASKNEDDIKRFIRDRMDNMGILSGLSAQVQGLREEIFAGLTKDARGDFINVDLLLNEISDKHRPAEIRAVLDKAKAGENRSDTIARQVERCNDTLGTDDILDLNELLAWTISTKRTLTLRELKAVLYMKTHESSLRSLYDQIRDRYSAFFYVSIEPDVPVDYAVVNLMSDSIEDYFKKATEIAETEASAASGDVSESEVKIVKRFLKSVCDDVLFAKFGFEELFRRKLDKSTTTIDVDLETTPLKLVLECLQAIDGKGDEEIKPLHNYAVYYFPDHLQEIDLSLADPKTKSIVGKKLLELFAEEAVIRKWWTEETPDLRYWWLYDNTYVDMILNWFKDSAVIKQVPEKHKEWIKNLTSNSKPDEDLLGPIAKVMASNWLQGSGLEWDTTGLFSFLHGYINKIKHRKDPQVKLPTADPSDKDVEASDILEAAEWAKQQLGVDQCDYEWVRSVARTLREYRKFGEAIAQFKIALTLASDHWLADYGLAQTYFEQGELQLAIHTLEPVAKLFQNGDIKIDDAQDELRGILRDLADWHKKLGNDVKAMEIYQSILEDNSDDNETSFDIIAIYHKQKKFIEVMDFMQMMKLHVNEKTGLNRLTQIYHDFALEEDYHNTIVMAAKSVNNLHVIKEDYQTALDTAKAKREATADPQEKYSMIAIDTVLSYYFGLALFRHYLDDNAKLQAIDLWERVMKVQAGTTAYYVQFIQQLTAKRLSLIYLERAREAGPESEAAAENVRKLIWLSSVSDAEEASSSLSDLNLKLLLGRYYKTLDNEERARGFLEGHVKIALGLLSDEDPTNDYDGYKRLADGLMFYNDNENALAAWSLIVPFEDDPTRAEPAEEKASDNLLPKELPSREGADSAIVESVAGASKTDQGSLLGEIEPSGGGAVNPNEPNVSQIVPTEPSTDGSGYSASSTKLVGPINYVCDGACDTEWTFANDIWVCKDCIDVMFDGCCLDLLRKGQLGFNVCNPEHEFLYVPKYDSEKAKRAGKDNVWVGEKIVPISEWLDGIRRDWGISGSDAKEEGKEEDD